VYLRLAGHHLTSINPSLRARNDTWDPWNPGDPARQPGYEHTQSPAETDISDIGRLRPDAQSTPVNDQG
jgi:hypothetical protein